ncbi:MAG: hypothetical protein IJ906_09835, partial [Oscillospiraceae bacterium]|nr:hypothetical protein [Oscillospiraceae bacterium]
QIAIIFKAVTDIILNLLDVFIGIFSGDWDTAWNGIKGIFISVWDFLKATLQNYLDAFCNLFGTDLESIKSFWVNIWTSIKDFFVNIWVGITGFFSNVLNGIAGFSHPSGTVSAALLWASGQPFTMTSACEST